MFQCQNKDMIRLNICTFLLDYFSFYLSGDIASDLAFLVFMHHDFTHCLFYVSYVECCVNI